VSGLSVVHRFLFFSPAPLLTCSPALLFSPRRGEKSRDDKTAIELFLTGVRGWEAGLWRRMNDGKSKQN
jgi:hypothetical protein